MLERINFNKGWKFCGEDLFPRNGADNYSGAKSKDNYYGAASPIYNDSTWQDVDLPHDYLIDDDYVTEVSHNIHENATEPELAFQNGFLRSGGHIEVHAAWYRKWLKIRPENENCRVYLHFDGVFRDCLLYVNAYYVCRHESGYDSFYVDISDFLDYENDNLIAVRINPEKHEGWWYEGAGIYRNVWIEVSDGIRFEPMGIYVCPDVNLETKSADIRISTELSNMLYTNENVKIQWEITDEGGKILASGDGEQHLCCRDTATAHFQTSLSDVILWDIGKPYLYTLKARLYHGETLMDQSIIPFGVRHTHFDKDNGFFLNGRHVKIHGVCCHQDHAGVGIAADKNIYEYRINRLMSMGANAYRTAHHMANPELLEVCDRMGMLVFEETRRMSTNPDDMYSVKTMVKRDRNHPSVFLWGIGNEELRSQGAPEMARATKAIIHEIRKIDTLRPVTSGVVMKDGVRQYENADYCIPVTKNLDVMGFNYESFAWDDYHKKVQDQPIIITEATSNSSTRGCYETKKDKGFFWIKDKDNQEKCKGAPEIKYQNEGEDEWSACSEREYLAGIFIWTGFDYRGEPCPMTYPAVMSYFGVFDYCGFAKDNFHYYKSWWQNEHVLHLLPHMNLKEKVGNKVDFYAFSNLDSAELFINGKSYGVAYNKKDRYIKWENVDYELGTALAVGYKDGKEVERCSISTTGTPAKICAEVFKTNLKIADTAIIDIKLVDEKGNIVPDDDRQLYFEVSGSGRFLGCGNGNPTDHSKDRCPERQTFRGLCQLLVKIEDKGETYVTIKGEGLDCIKITIGSGDII